MSTYPQVSLCWQASATPDELHSILRTLGEEYPIREGSAGDVALRFERSEQADAGSVTRRGGTATIRYGRPALAMRAVGSLLAGLVADGGTQGEETPFTSFGIMLDCSRNAVMTVDHFKHWLRRLTLLGYNMAMLYTEDTYEIPGEPFFGYQRGRYTLAELQEIDAYAHALGVEMIGCIQTLGHLAQILRWPAYHEVRDTAGVLLVGEEKTYALIEKMIARMSQAFKSRRLHIGMDEAHDVGRGAYLERHGIRPQFDIFNEHLARVVEICTRHGIEPMIWSDMYFRMGSATGDYYDKDCVIPDAVKDAIPTETRLVYWDYYHEDKDFYLDWIDRHRALGFDPVMGSGAWTWLKVWYDRLLTEKTAGPCIEACRESGVKEIFFTLWGDDGSYCDFDSVLVGLAYTAEKAYRNAGSGDPMLAARYQAICQADYAAQSRAGEADGDYVCSGYVFWDDPLYALVLRNVATKDHIDLRRREQVYRGIARDLEPQLADAAAGDVHHAWLAMNYLAEKVAISIDLYEAYAQRDMAALAQLGSRALRLADQLIELSASFKAIWMRHNKPFGFEVLQIRLAGLVARYRELADRLQRLVDGVDDCIPELDGNLDTPDGYLPGMNYHNSAVPTAIF